MEICDEKMSAVRASVEWLFADIVNSFKFQKEFEDTCKSSSQPLDIRVIVSKIIAYHVAKFRANHFQNTPCPAVFS